MHYHRGLLNKEVRRTRKKLVITRPLNNNMPPQHFHLDKEITVEMFQYIV